MFAGLLAGVTYALERVRIVPENAVDCAGLLIKKEQTSYVAVRVKKWP